MVSYQWPLPPMAVVQRFEARRGERAPVGALVMWSAWTVDALHYLEELDQASHVYRTDNYSTSVIDIAHARWASSSAVTALDLCAAALARECCAWTNRREADLRDLTPGSNRKDASRLRKLLPSAALTWVDQVTADPRYLEVQGARNPLTHARLQRIIGTGRTRFLVAATGNVIEAPDFVAMSRQLATASVEGFLAVLDHL